MSHGWILTLITAVVAVCAIMAAFGFRGRVTTVGIDLGTTFSVVGVKVNGKTVIVTDDEGHQIFPSVVTYMDNGDILAAYQAMPYMNLRPASTIFNAKRFIGKSLRDDEFALYASAHPFKVVGINSSKVSNYSQVGFDVQVRGEPHLISPEDVGTQVLKHLLDITADFLGHKQVNKAVIAVPAKFSAQQRQATGEAYKKAGLKVMRVLEEPTAAAVAYRLHKRTDIHHILVYDFGGGTLDVSLLYVSRGSVQVLYFTSTTVLSSTSSKKKIGFLHA
jgi:molecular chaperone DnaK (HSP70)